MAEFKSEHNLDFYAALWARDPNFVCFKIGTCDGLYGTTDKTFDIIAVTNNVAGNGHFTDVLQWFELSCKRDKKHLRVLEIWNQGLAQHLVTKRGFKKIDDLNVIKEYTSMK